MTHHGKEEEDKAAAPALVRVARIASETRPPFVNCVTGVAYKSVAANLPNHTDSTTGPLYTMSLALGHAIEFTVGRATPRPGPMERSGKPVTIRMESGDAIYFDGGTVPHCVERIVPDSAPGFWKGVGLGFARVVLLFREPHGM